MTDAPPLYVLDVLLSVQPLNEYPVRFGVQIVVVPEYVVFEHPEPPFKLYVILYVICVHCACKLKFKFVTDAPPLYVFDVFISFHPLKVYPSRVGVQSVCEFVYDTFAGHPVPPALSYVIVYEVGVGDDDSHTSPSIKTPALTLP